MAQVHTPQCQTGKRDRTTKGEGKLLDFGPATLVDVSLTETGSTMGTAPYMSPEQTRGDRVDHRTDLWSFGVVLYEMLTGERPFQGKYHVWIPFSTVFVTTHASRCCWKRWG